MLLSIQNLWRSYTLLRIFLVLSRCDSCACLITNSLCCWLHALRVHDRLFVAWDLADRAPHALAAFVLRIAFLLWALEYVNRQCCEHGFWHSVFSWCKNRRYRLFNMSCRKDPEWELECRFCSLLASTMLKDYSHRACWKMLWAQTIIDSIFLNISWITGLKREVMKLRNLKHLGKLLSFFFSSSISFNHFTSVILPRNNLSKNNYWLKYPQRTVKGCYAMAGFL